jgi:hypothetical protein
MAAGSATATSSAGPTSPPPAAGIDAGEIRPNVDRDDASRTGDSNRRPPRAREAVFESGYKSQLLIRTGLLS